MFELFELLNVLKVALHRGWNVHDFIEILIQTEHVNQLNVGNSNENESDRHENLFLY